MLSGGQFGPLYHGSAHNIPVGEKIMPGVHDNDDHFGDAHGQVASRHAFASDRESVGWDFAYRTSKIHGGRSRVNIVEPHPDMKPGVFNSEHPDYPSKNPFTHANIREYIAPYFKVTDHIDIMPGRQGTLPIDWEPHRDPNKFTNVNHPDEYDFNAEHPAHIDHVEISPKVSRDQLDLITGRRAGDLRGPENLKFYHDTSTHEYDPNQHMPYGMSEYKGINRHISYGSRRAMWPPER